MEAKTYFTDFIISHVRTTTYKDAGVDQEKAGQILSAFAKFLSTRPKDPNLLSGIGPFASCYDLSKATSGLDEPVLVTSCDGVGTKSLLALEWGAIENLGQDLVAMNVNDVLCVGATPILFLDYFACGKLRDEQLTTLLKSIQLACESCGCSLAGGETAEMPGLYKELDFDLAGFAAGLVDKKKILGATKVKTGDKLLALESSGLHSNGYSLVRKVLAQEKISADSRSPVGKSWKECLLTPTTLYVPILRNHLDEVHALAHLTGGGLFENLPRVIPKGLQAVVHAKQWTIPPLFSWLGEKAKLSTEQLLTTFNCGVGMIAVVDAKKAPGLSRKISDEGTRCWEIGEITAQSPDAPSRVVWE